MQIFTNPNFNFIKYRWHALVLSVAVILGGSLVTWARGGLLLGVEFSGGTMLVVQFDQMPSTESVRGAVGRAFPGGGQNIVVQTYGASSQRQVMVRVPEVGEESGTDLGRTRDAIIQALGQANLGKFEVMSTEIIGPVVGRDLTRKGILATVLALAGILLYIAFRFRFSFAVGAVVATVHDVLVTLAFLTFFGYELSLNVIAAILTLTGYSVNDTIVVFDRVRENLRGSRRDKIEEVLNRGVNETLNRTVLTAGTTLLSVLALFLFGGEVLRPFAFTMIVGIITGTYSTVYIAAAIVTIWRPRTPRAAVAPATNGSQGRSQPQTARARAKAPRKARTS
jgi:preprotein translocase subunit SecF